MNHKSFPPHKLHKVSAAAGHRRHEAALPHVQSAVAGKGRQLWQPLAEQESTFCITESIKCPFPKR